jgi:hypothetical protein
MHPFPAVIWPTGGHPDNSLPGFGGRPDNSLPGIPGRPDQGLPPPVGTWPPRPVVWPPHPPIFVPPDDNVGIELPIYLPGSPDNGLPPVEVEPGRPANPIVLPPLPDGSNVMLALVLPLPNAEPKGATPEGTMPALLWYGPGTLPMVVYLPKPGTPK